MSVIVPRVSVREDESVTRSPEIVKFPEALLTVCVREILSELPVSFIAVLPC